MSRGAMTREEYRRDQPPSRPGDGYGWLRAAIPAGDGEAVVVAGDPAIAEVVAAGGWQPRLVDPHGLGDPAAARARWRAPVGLVVVDQALTGYHHADKRAWAANFARRLHRDGTLVVREPTPLAAAPSRWRRLRRVLRQDRRHRGPASSEFWTQAVRDAGLTDIEVADDQGYLVLTARHRR